MELAVALGPLALSNPVMPASGCFGPELAPVMDASSLGAVVTKTVFAAPRGGNPAPRLAETPHGLLNSVGIPSPGIDRFRAEVLPRYQTLGVPVIVSIGGLGIDEFFAVAEGLRNTDVAALEVNVSCPNLEAGGLAIGTSAVAVAEVVAGVRRLSHLPLIVKLSPAVTSIADIATAAEESGADVLTVANSFPGTAIDVTTRRPLLGRGGGGYSGPGIKPIAVKLVADTAAAVSIPVIGCGGITTAEDVAEFLIAGAVAVQVGTATFTRPTAMNEILADLPGLLERLGASAPADLVGAEAVQ